MNGNTGSYGSNGSAGSCGVNVWTSKDGSEVKATYYGFNGQ